MPTREFPSARILLVTCLGLGHMRPAPGTWGSMPPVAIALLLVWTGLGPATASWLYHAVIVAVLVLFAAACVVAGDEAEARFGRKDPSQVVADETAGQCVALLGLPASATIDPLHLLATLAVAFLAFRVLDILKPWPAGALQAIPGGWGILLDDLVAGFQALIVVQAFAWFVLPGLA